ncbi:gamma-glutamylcyclotransferase-like isoform X1 [Photinus pyralis]|uniref:gamma-glutamylcyclotransferase n=1 Tax=Photinus pyralis TaxID=7054 RepID=A0A1Y1L9U9_PHOPY|nr:gamma-glutamylcyclotransferase-like isoform X1 [Photinus pyralis]
MCEAKRCYYFAYGSNLLQTRMHVNVDSATRAGCGKLMNYRLDFFRYSKRWHGCSATIVPHNGYEVWGAIWEIDVQQLSSLDLYVSAIFQFQVSDTLHFSQEGVHQNIYFRFNAPIFLPDGSTKTCYVYQQVAEPSTHYKLTQFPADRQPSYVYKDVIVRGAAEAKLPEVYQELLRGILCNDYKGSVDLQLIE